MDEPSTEQVERLDAILDKIRLEFNAQIIRPRDRNAEAMAGWYRRVVAHMRRQARQIVKNSQKRALATSPKVKGVKVSKAGRMKAWGFLEEETSIDSDANEDRIKEVLENIGRGDEFENLRERAYSEIE